MAYWIALPPPIVNLHDMLHVSQLGRYILDPSHVIQMDDVRMRENLTVEASLMQIDVQKVKKLCGKKIVLVKVVWGGPTGGSITWELQSQMRESYSTMFPLGIFR